MQTYEEAAAALARQAEDVAAAWSVAGDLLHECERLSVPPPSAVRQEQGLPHLDWSAGDVWRVSVQCQPSGSCRLFPDGTGPGVGAGGVAGVAAWLAWLAGRPGEGG